MTVESTLSRAHHNTVALYGKQISWRLPGVALSEGEVKRRLVEAGLNPDATPRVRGTTTAVRTLKKLQQDTEGGFVTEAPGHNGCTNYFIVLPAFNSVGEIEFRAEKVVYNPHNDTLTAENPDRQLAVDEALARFADCLLGADIRRALTNIVKDEGAVPFMNGSGVYILPENKLDVADKIEKFVTSLGKRCSVRIMELAKTEANRKTMVEASREDLLSEIAALADELTKLESASTLVDNPGILVSILGYQASFDEPLNPSQGIKAGDTLSVLSGGAFYEFVIDRVNDDGSLMLLQPAARPIIGTFTIERPSAKRVRQSTWTTKMALLKEKTVKAEMYADLLAFKADDIRTAIQEQMERVTARLI